MANSYPTGFSGGPCNGRLVQLPEAQIRAGAVSCGGANYYIVAAGADVYRAVWAKPVDQPAPAGVTAGHAQFEQTWGRLMRTLAFSLPEGTRRIVAAGERLTRTVR